MNIFQKVMPEGGKLGFDGRVINDQMGEDLQEVLEDKHDNDFL